MSNQQKNREDFLSDPKFLDWLSHPDSDLDNYWNNWLLSHPEQKTELEKAKAFVKGISFEKTPLNASVKEDLLQKIHNDLASSEVKKVSIKTWLRMAAGIALLIGTLLYVNWTPNSYTVPYGSTKTIDLPDGSRVMINANSTLRYEPGWKEQTPREVWLDGEAFFQVTPSPKVGARSFVVHTDKGDIQVLGTMFNVKDRKNNFSVALTEGAVLLALPEETIAMKPGEFVDLDLSSNTFSKKTTNTAVFTAWTKGRLVFDNTSISYLVSVIEDQYGYQVKVANEALLERELNGGLRNPSLDELINGIEAAFDIKIKKTGERSLTISY